MQTQPHFRNHYFSHIFTTTWGYSELSGNSWATDRSQDAWKDLGLHLLLENLALAKQNTGTDQFSQRFLKDIFKVLCSDFKSYILYIEFWPTVQGSCSIHHRAELPNLAAVWIILPTDVDMTDMNEKTSRILDSFAIKLGSGFVSIFRSIKLNKFSTF